MNHPTTLSFWERESFFKGIDVAIIGCGIVGLNAAIRLKEIDPTISVAIFERGALPEGASTRKQIENDDARVVTERFFLEQKSERFTFARIETKQDERGASPDLVGRWMSTCRKPSKDGSYRTLCGVMGKRRRRERRSHGYQEDRQARHGDVRSRRGKRQSSPGGTREKGYAAKAKRFWHGEQSVQQRVIARHFHPSATVAPPRVVS